MEEELLDPSESLKKRRGQTLNVVSILSWIWMAYSIVLICYNLIGGPKSTEQMNEAKVQLISSYTDEMIDFMGNMLECKFQTIIFTLFL